MFVSAKSIELIIIQHLLQIHKITDKDWTHCSGCKSHTVGWMFPIVVAVNDKHSLCSSDKLNFLVIPRSLKQSSTDDVESDQINL